MGSPPPSPPPPPPPGGRCSESGSAPNPRRQLNPEASPFSATPGAGPSHPVEGSPEGICFSIPSDSDEDGDEDDDLHWIPPCTSPKGKSAAVAGRRRSTSPARAPDGFMADARRSGHAPSRSFSPPLVDEEGFRRVVSRRRLREIARRAPPPIRVRRPVPADLVGRCFNCLAFDHVASQCIHPSRCLRCEKVGHVAKNCKRPRFPSFPQRGRGRPVRRADLAADAAVAPNRRGVGRSAASASTASSGSASTGRDYSGPPSVCAASPMDRSSSPDGRRRSPADRSEGFPPPPELPLGHPSRRIASVTRTILRTSELQQEEDALVDTALVVLVLGTRPSLAPYQVRRFL
ncbi:hypothetical protein PVAP13_3NG189289 [Panicum virgatum]|uniref:CCHC-type domain-containing protein n=1 Tax=Panicum virgatum TaxID=38727 RepID=A0A8T0U935_PANVG|nr:hypothetical protein PVAP13_3NG189289 [Panicum virgatum]